MFGWVGGTYPPRWHPWCPPHFQVARPLRGEAATPVALVAEESGRCRGVVEGERQESGVGSRGRRAEEVVDKAGDEVADECRPTPARLPGATLAPVAPRAFM